MRNTIIGALIRLARVVMKTDPSKVVILPSANAGSLGDQAMLDSISTHLIHTSGKTPVLIARSSDAIALRNTVEMAFIDAPGIMGKIRTARQIFSCGHLLFIGADVIDGVYGGDCARLGLLDIAARSGLTCAAVNFSFSENPGAAAMARLRKLPDIPMHPRDPVSMQRFKTALKRSATQVADVAFLLKPETTSANAQTAIDWASAHRDAGRVVMGVNAGGTTLSKMDGDGLDTLGQCLEVWLAANSDRAILLLPHDYKPQPTGDVEPLQALHDRLSPLYGDRVHMVQFPFDTWDVKAMAGALDFTLLARMHFAIACLGMGVPPNKFKNK